MSEIQFKSTVESELIQAVGSDDMIAMAARVSTTGGKKTKDGKIKPLLNFLMRDRHGSPFEHGSMTFRIHAPIFVAREFMRHRAGWSYNEESARYKELEPVFYVPDSSRLLIQIGKPGAYSFEPGSYDQFASLNGSMWVAYREAWQQYQRMLDAEIAREVARAVLPVGTFTSFYATCNPRSLMHFLSLRTKHEDAKVPSFPQWEIEMVAEQMEREFSAQFPLTHELFTTHGRVAP